MVKKHRDIEWNNLGRQALQHATEGDWLMAGTTYYQMAAFVDEEGRDGNYLRDDGYKLKHKGVKEKLDGYAVSGVVNSVQVYANLKGKNTSCEHCKKGHGKIYTIAEAATANPIPIRECTYGFGCRCTYIPVVDELT